MKKFLFWFIAIVITLSSAVYQRLTGPTYPVRGKVMLADAEIRYELPRSEEIAKNCEVGVRAANLRITGRLLYKRFKTADPWTEVPLARETDMLVGYLPKQPMAGKLAYKVFLSYREKETSLSGEEPIIIRFKGTVPAAILIPHMLLMFLAMLFSTCAGIAALRRQSNARKFAIWTAGLLFVGGFILGPLVQKSAFGDWWTGVPFGFDLTDNKTLIAMLGWVAALIAGRRGKPSRGWVLAASILTLVIFMIPHSLLGSELKYTESLQ
jgi:hypothetical protein